MQPLDSVKVACNTVGVAGSAGVTAYSDRPINGEIAALYVDWAATAPATSHITVTIDSDDNHPAITLYAKEDAATDLWVYPKVQSTDTAGAAIAAQYQPIVGSGRVKIVVANSNELTPAVTVYVYVKGRD